MKMTVNGLVSKIGSGLMIGIVLLALVGMASATDPSIEIYTISSTIIVPPQITRIDVRFSESVDYIIAIENSAGAVVRDWDGIKVANPNKKKWDGTYEINGTTVPDGIYTVNVTGENATGGRVTDASRTIEVITGNSPPEGNLEKIDARWESPYIIATATDFGHPDKWYQYRYYQPGSLPDVGPYSATNPGGYFVSDPWVPNEDGDPYTDTFNVETSGAHSATGISWRVCLYKDGVFKEGDSEPPGAVTSPRGCKTVGDDPSIPEFATIAIPVVAILGLVAFYRRKQKK